MRGSRCKSAGPDSRPAASEYARGHHPSAAVACPEGLERHLSRQCLPDPIDPVYLARMVLFLASDDSAMCTANNYMVEAGSI